MDTYNASATPRADGSTDALVTVVDVTGREVWVRSDLAPRWPLG